MKTKEKSDYPNLTDSDEVKMFHSVEEEDLFMVRHLNTRIKELEEELFQLEMKSAYARSLKEGVSSSQIQEFTVQDEEMLTHALAFKQSFGACKASFFGYPGNLTTDSPLVRKLREEEAE
ncbi:MAG: hypothetical protein WBL80_05250, partial [Erysipelotrichaceae bacterium]